MSRSQSGREFLVEIATLRLQPGSRRELHVEAPIEDLAVTHSQVPERSPVALDVVLESVSGGILVSGTLRAPWVGECRRCLEEATGTLEAEILELCELEPGDEELTYRLTREQLDLLPIAHDACILELPLAPLCREDCLGLCPTCGVNRNLETCSCQPVREGHFAVLSVLQQAEESEHPADKT